MKILIILVLTFLIILVACYIANIVSSAIEMFYAKACLLQTIDEIIKMIRYEQIILAKLGISYKTPICRSNFNELIIPVYNGIRRAYQDLHYKENTYSHNHVESLIQSYTDNINSINLLLLDYDVYNVRYSVARDKLLFADKLFTDYPFLDTDLQFRLDNGIEGTGVIGN